MRRLSDAEILDLIDAGRPLSSENRAVAILRLVTGAAEEALERLSRAERDALLIGARARTIGPRLEACITCGACGTLLEATVECDALAADPPDAFDLTCDGCGAQSASPFDISTFFWRELSARAQQILLDVHELAGAYGWRESDVLSLSPSRRRRYLELLGDPGPLEIARDEPPSAEHAAGVPIEPRASHRDGPSTMRVTAPESAPADDASSRHPVDSGDEAMPAPLARERATGREVVPSIADSARGMAVRALRAAATISSRRERTTAQPARPQVTVNIARIDVSARPAQASTIPARQKRRDAGVSLSTYLAARQTETR
jgi:hypothetical protein